MQVALRCFWTKEKEMKKMGSTRNTVKESGRKGKMIAERDAKNKKIND